VPRQPTADIAERFYGPPRPPLPVDPPGTCTTPRCGVVADDEDDSGPSWHGWVRAGVYGSREPDRLWCSGQCAAYGIALAQLRMAGGK
jgi:hypothetical protein